MLCLEIPQIEAEQRVSAAIYAKIPAVPQCCEDCMPAMPCRIRWKSAWVLLAFLLGLAGCSESAPPPLTLGYLGELTGYAADLGTGGRNGVQLAVELANATGGVNGRQVRLLIKDSESKPDRGQAMLAELIRERPEAILGPMTSAVAVAVAPQATEAGILMMGGTVTTNDLSGKDDQFFRALPANAYQATRLAGFLHEKYKVRSASVLVNLSNRAYSDSWASDFAKKLGELGGRVKRVDYAGTDDTRFLDLARALMAGKPDAIVLVTSAVDAARIASQLNRSGSRALHATSEWAATSVLLELGGRNLEGFVIPLYMDLNSAVPQFREFRAAYEARFQQSPGYPAMVAYNGAQIVLRGLREKRKDETLKQTIMRIGTFQGLQYSVSLDRYGDTAAPTFITQVRDGRYVVLPK